MSISKTCSLNDLLMDAHDSNVVSDFVRTLDKIFDTKWMLLLVRSGTGDGWYLQDIIEVENLEGAPW